MQYLRIGKITGAHGLHGRLKVFVTTDIRERFDVGQEVFLKKGENYYPRRILESIEQKGALFLIALEGVEDRDQAMGEKGNELFIPQSLAEETKASLPPDEFYHYDIIQCDVYRDDVKFGTVTDILKAGNGDVLLINDLNGKQHMVPFVKTMVDLKELRRGRIDITPVEGLLDD
ncbi:MAG TPA: ribosome maturation factor RimM [Spirochaetota bacterium]|nr:ribosome maturation factor RimM [Spirochaetota bacterium]HPJ39687.1 ribosome maturation factor RimM [Spirochaetota bacterium]HPQ52709.1 ribosome maturation factor RimM [Spirochaetota bacterium]